MPGTQGGQPAQEDTASLQRVPHGVGGGDSEGELRGPQTERPVGLETGGRTPHGGGGGVLPGHCPPREPGLRSLREGTDTTQNVQEGPAEG